MVNRFDLHDLEPEIKFSATGAAYFPNDAHLAPAELVKDLAAYLERSGVRIVRNISVTTFATSQGKIESVKTSGGEFTADEYVMAAGAWTSQLLKHIGIQLPLQPGKGYSITHSNPPVKPRIPAIFIERRCAVTPLTYSLRFAGTMEFSGMDLSLNQERIGAILDAIPRYYGNVSKPDPAKSLLWAGLRPVTPDGLPYIGRFNKYSNLIAATGHAMLGVSLGTITGKLVAEIAADKTPSHDITFLRPDRFT
jgi:D-amino-acid dehydrogenase